MTTNGFSVEVNFSYRLAKSIVVNAPSTQRNRFDTREVKIKVDSNFPRTSVVTVRIPPARSLDICVNLDTNKATLFTDTGNQALSVSGSK